MQEGLPLYNGAQPVAAQQKFVGVPQLPQGQGFGEAFDAAVRDGLQIVDTYTKLHDFAEEQRVEHQLRLNDRKMQEELLQAQNARWGTKGSFFNADGSVNEDTVAAFCSRWREANDGIERSFWRRDNAIRDAGRMSRQNDDLTTRIELGVMRQAIANGKKAFEANYGAAVESGDYEGAARSLQAAVEAGQISEAEAQRRLKGLTRRAGRRRAEGKPAEQDVDDTLAALGEEQETATTADDTAAPATVTDATEGAAPATGADATDLTTDVGRMRDVGAESPVGAITLNRNMAGDVANADVKDLPVVEQVRLFTNRVVRMCAPYYDAASGRSSISPVAPVGAQVAVQEANAAGGWTRETYDRAVYSLGVDIVRGEAYKDLTDAEMEKLIRETVTVDGMADQLFGADEHSEAAYTSYLNGKVASLMSLRDGALTARVDAAFKGRPDVDGDEIDRPEQKIEKDYVTMRASEALLKYRMENHERDWYAEQEVISKAITEAKDDFAENEEAASAYFASRKAKEAEMVRGLEADLKVYRPKVLAAQAAADDKKKREAEAKKKPKKPTKDELLAERPYLGEVDFVFGFKKTKHKIPTMTVPKAEYVEMLRQLECTNGEALYCTIGKTELLVIPGEGDECSVNREALIELTRGMSEKNMVAAIRGIYNGARSKVQVRKGRKTVGKRKTNKNK